ncbi:MAG: ABC transporter substrate-binding protein [Brevibacterium aurantiacum]|uniref:Carbohydrate ABC transporter substrate-binding protein, CUT1 family n=1 Tax=Brevibacterium aurantiacum TaxID=273384 RepID=A0A2A3ZT45_BREAU|nr:sugar ABC transporter substrate-binding protein [Brevibacterium aurantiacum]MDN5593104.1 sugar ABC transporter substrate-binding protein [Brevibacterium sp.]AZL06563.1 sugar ABC transporter substrate-binding protein [Brevibacterium aurantiacum]AZL10156.1 sugar ABC transporter substrate-binding protein [Brevibacterium aurantiacum]AZL13864.1 sugar ABC transporter substrate-binding protein [Brevibacterium aurantiacum]AZT94371.1 sugar ABC transporter substrate-binding protein [Brevibacterium au
MKQKITSRAVTAAAIGVVGALTLAGCGGAGGSSSGGGNEEVNVLMVNNPQMQDLQKLTAEHFTKDTGIKVNYTVLPENEVRAKIGQEFSAQAGNYDVASMSNYEVPTYAKNGWLTSMDEGVVDAEGFNQGDILAPMAESMTFEDQIYGEPFYGEGSFLMYRKDIFEKADATMPDDPTWDEVADLAKKVDGAEKGTKGICLRGLPGWGEMFAPLTTVVNTFGGTWFDENWEAQVDSKEFKEAANFYVDLIKDHGESGAPQAGYTECLTNLQQGNVAMWYDSTAATGTLEADDSPVKDKIGYVAAPVKDTESSSWLYTWAWGIQKAGKNQDAAKQFVAWASSQDYEETVAEELGWQHVPAGKRTSTYENADYQKAAAPFYKQTEEAINSADPKNPGVQPRPTLGVQFVTIPEFADLATGISEDISSAIAGRTTVDKALQKGQKEAEKVGDKYKK